MKKRTTVRARELLFKKWFVSQSIVCPCHSSGRGEAGEAQLIWIICGSQDQSQSDIWTVRELGLTVDLQQFDFVCIYT